MNKVDKLVRVQKGAVIVSSRDVAEKFKKNHADVLRAIKNIIKDSSADVVSEAFSRSNFAESVFRTARGKDYPEYLMTRSGFSLLVMGFTGKDALIWKIRFIEAFDFMERELIRLKVQNSELEWKVAREQGKATRRSETDVIQKFVDYAEKQGSKNARRYYQHYTNLAYTAVSIVDKASTGVSTVYRDLLNRMEINQLECAECIATHWIAKGMEQGMEYHDIYAMVREKVIETMAITLLPVTYVDKAITGNRAKLKS